MTCNISYKLKPAGLSVVCPVFSMANKYTGEPLYTHWPIDQLYQHFMTQSVPVPRLFSTGNWDNTIQENEVTL